MNQSESQDRRDVLDAATSARLVKLAALPVDTSGLEAVIQREVGARANRATPLWYWLSPLRAAAALLVLGLVIAATILATGGGEARASAAQMAQWHRDMVAERVPVMKVSSMAEASTTLASMGAVGMPTLGQVPEAHAMACCMRDIQNKRVAVVLLKDAAGPVTLSVARAEDMKVPRTRPITRDGVKYYIEQFEDLRMVTTERDGRWVCLIGAVSSDTLIDLAGSLRF